MSYDLALTHHLQRMLMADCGLEWQDVQLDEDAEICFRDSYDRVMTAHVLERVTVWLHLWVLAANGVPVKAKVLREVNELNLSLLGARAELTPWGSLILSAEVALESVEPGELGTLVELLSENAERSGPMIQMMFGASGAPKEPREVES